MQFAFSKPTAHEADTEILFREFGQIGYQGLELKGSQYAAWLQRPEEFKERYAPFPGVAAGLICSGGIDETSMAKLDAVCQFGARVGSDLIIYCQGAPARADLRPGDRQRFARILSEAGKRAQGMGLKLSLHHHFENPVMLLSEFHGFFNEVETIAPLTVGLSVDTAHLVKSGITDIAGAITTFRGVIDNFHLKDFSDGQWQVLGEGVIDFAPVFAAITSIGYDGWVSCDEESDAELLGTIRQCLAYMKTF